MPNSAKSHDQNRQTLCLLCLGKSKDMRPINSKHREIINEHIVQYDVEDNRLPNALCSTCRVVVLDYGRGNFKRRLDVADLSVMAGAPPSTRSNSTCPCTLCDLASASINPSSTLSTKIRRGRPSLSELPENVKHRATVSTSLCSKCLSTVAKGIEHKCCETSRQKNIQRLIDNSHQNTKEQVASRVIKDKMESPKMSTSVRLSSGGRPLEVVGTAAIQSTSPQLISAHGMSMMQVDLNLSTNKTLAIAHHIRSSSRKRGAVESDLKSKLRQRNHLLDEYFDVATTTDFQDKDGSIQQQPTIYCCDLNGILHRIQEERNITAEDLTIKIGIDGGGGFLKVCLTVLSSNSLLQERRRMPYVQGASKSCKETSVKKIFLIAIVPIVYETYRNILQLWVLLKLKDVLCNKMIVSADLKLGNVIFGLNAHSSSHPCCWCSVDKANLSNNATLRTLGRVADQYWMWQAAGAVPSSAKHYENCVHTGLVKGDRESLIIDIYPPPELHLMLGVVNHLYKAIEQEWAGVRHWAETCHVERQAYQGGSFDGNSCRKLLKNVDHLQSMCPLQVLKFVKALRDFNQVVSACFGAELDVDCFAKYIHDFRESYLDLGIPVTPKAHRVFYHVEEYCRRNNSSLGRSSEQSLEAVHSDFKSTWSKYKVSRDHPDYPSALLRAVREYNSQHI